MKALQLIKQRAGYLMMLCWLSPWSTVFHEKLIVAQFGKKKLSAEHAYILKSYALTK
jgi:hypothetical protein